MSADVAKAPAVVGVHPAGAAAGSKPPLDDVMLAMDVVDTLRRRERLVKRELDEAGREDDLKARLRKIYAAQGIEVPDHVIEQGVAALKEERFTYKPPPESIGTKLARIYVSRGRWGKWVGGAAGVGVLAGAVNYFTVVGPNARLPDDLADLRTQAVELAQTEEAREALERFYNLGQAALKKDDTDAARDALAHLEDIRTTLEQEYTLRIVNRPGERSGVWRIPDANVGARNFYVIVEAVDPTGKILKVPIENEESGAIERVPAWGLRVDQGTFESVGSDKADDGIIERDRFGYKSRGHLTPEYEMKTTGGAITQW